MSSLPPGDGGDMFRHIYEQALQDWAVFVPARRQRRTSDHSLQTLDTSAQQPVSESNSYRAYQTGVCPTQHAKKLPFSQAVATDDSLTRTEATNSPGILPLEVLNAFSTTRQQPPALEQYVRCDEYRLRKHYRDVAQSTMQPQKNISVRFPSQYDDQVSSQHGVLQFGQAELPSQLRPAGGQVKQQQQPRQPGLVKSIGYADSYPYDTMKTASNAKPDLHAWSNTSSIPEKEHFHVKAARDSAHKPVRELFPEMGVKERLHAFVSRKKEARELFPQSTQAKIMRSVHDESKNAPGVRRDNFSRTRSSPPSSPLPPPLNPEDVKAPSAFDLARAATFLARLDHLLAPDMPRRHKMQKYDADPDEFTWGVKPKPGITLRSGKRIGWIDSAKVAERRAAGNRLLRQGRGAHGSERRGDEA